MVAVIRMALHESYHPEADFNQVDVRLHNADASGNIGSIIAAFTRGGLTDFGLSDPPTTITSFDPAVTLTAGNDYWIVIAPAMIARMRCGTGTPAQAAVVLFRPTVGSVMVTSTAASAQCELK